ALARVYGRGLDHRASRGNHPVEALALREAPERASFFSARANCPDAVRVRANGFHVDVRVERAEPCFIERETRFEEILGRARHDHADVDELLAFDTRHDPHDCVIVVIGIAHESPPPRECVNARAFASDTRYRHLDTAARSESAGRSSASSPAPRIRSAR